MVDFLNRLVMLAMLVMVATIIFFGMAVQVLGESATDQRHNQMVNYRRFERGSDPFVNHTTFYVDDYVD